MEDSGTPPDSAGDAAGEGGMDAVEDLAQDAPAEVSEAGMDALAPPLDAVEDADTGTVASPDAADGGEEPRGDAREDIVGDLARDASGDARGDGARDAADSAGTYTRPPPITVPPPPMVDAAALPFPRTDAGTLELMNIPGGRLELDPAHRSPVTAYGRCLDLVTFCISPPARSLDQCMVYAPLCRTARPWEEADPCCPVACRDEYEAARSAGSRDLAAFSVVFRRSLRCFPGLLAELGRTP
jgi:hypothetical protein